MKKIRAAVVGYGNIGHYTVQALEAAKDFEIAGIVRRNGAENKPAELAQYDVVKDIRDLNDQPVINAVTGVAEQYERTINYIQVPIMAHLAWGRENRGVNFFVNAGPQFGVYLSESTKSNFDWDKRNMADRANSICAQDTMAVENKFDYGIAAGAGIEFANPKVGRFLLEGRYYYGLGNIYGDSKRDYFGSSNFGTITIKLTYLFDITR